MGQVPGRRGPGGLRPPVPGSPDPGAVAGVGLQEPRLPAAHLLLLPTC